MSSNNIPEETMITPVIKDLETLFKKSFQFIKSVLTFVINSISQFVSFCLKHILILVMMTLMGGLVGYYSSKLFQNNYKSYLILKTNVNAQSQLYSSIANINALIESSQYDAISNMLNISEKEAKSIKSFSIEPNLSSFKKAQAFNELYKHIDSSARPNIEDLLRKDPSLSDEFVISIISSNQNVFSKIEKPLVLFFENDETIQSKRSNQNRIILIEQEYLRKELSMLDSLNAIYNASLLAPNETKLNASVKIDVEPDGDQPKLDILSMYHYRKNVIDELIKIEHRINASGKCYSVESHLSGVGTKMGVNTKTRTFGLAFTFFVISLLVISLYYHKKNKG